MENTIRYNIDNIAIQNMNNNPIEDTDYVYATGIRGFVKRRRNVADRRMARKDKRIEGRNIAKTGRSSAKQTKAASQLESSKGDVEMAKALSSNTSKKSNTGLYIGLGVGALVLVGVAYFFLKGKKR